MQFLKLGTDLKTDPQRYILGVSRRPSLGEKGPDPFHGEEMAGKGLTIAGRIFSEDIQCLQVEAGQLGQGFPRGIAAWQAEAQPNAVGHVIAVIESDF
jgi:hypothetical protein